MSVEGKAALSGLAAALVLPGLSLFLPTATAATAKQQSTNAVSAAASPGRVVGKNKLAISNSADTITRAIGKWVVPPCILAQRVLLITVCLPNRYFALRGESTTASVLLPST